VCFLEPIYPDQVQGRRQIADTARARIIAAMEA
jgi:1-acyl-sn-glycerol-3-phosphate acyltransferase